MVQLHGTTSSLATVGADHLPMALSAAQADSDLVSIVQLGLGAQTPGELVAALIPAHGYIPRTRTRLRVRVTQVFNDDVMIA
jgi:hypothetical protein